MKAIVQARYGPPAKVLSVRDIERPVPGPGEVLVRMRAASVHADVWHVVLGVPLVLRIMGAGARRPKVCVPGTDVAGVVESVGPQVDGFRPGDEVFGETISGTQWTNGGTFAEYVVARQEWLRHKPRRVMFDEAATATSFIIAYQNLRQGGPLGPGRRVLVNGAGGAVGTLALQIAKAAGAEVTAVDAASKLDALRALGADHVIDYAKEDFTRGTARYDVILDVPGNHSFADVTRALAPTGKYVLVGHDAYGTQGRRVFGSLPRFLGLVLRGRRSGHLPDKMFYSPDKTEALDALRAGLEDGTLRPPVARRFPFEEVVAAIGSLTTQEGVGRVVLVSENP